MTSIAQFFQTCTEWITTTENAPAVLVAIFVTYVISKFVLAYFQHKADRRARRYNRASEIGAVRFEKEAEHLEKLSNALLCLVVETEPIRKYKSKRYLSTQERTRWLKLYRNAVSCLGSAAPFLNYVDLKTGMMKCGVKDDSLGKHLDCKDCRGREGLEMHVFVLDSRSLYMRAALLIDACARIVQGHIAENLGSVLGKDFLEDTPYAKSIEEDISVKYSHFLNCAYCRLKDCEMGSRDARWKRLKNWLFKIVVWMFPSIYHYFDPACPYESIEDDDSSLVGDKANRRDKRKLLEERRKSFNFKARIKTVIFSGLLIVTIVLLAVFVIWPFIVFVFDSLTAAMSQR